MNDLEIKLLLQSVQEKYGYDFTNYKTGSVARRLDLFLASSGRKHLSELIPLVLHNPETFDLLLNTLTINVTGMFRDPAIFSFIREKIFPVLATFPRLNIWSAGCSSGQEAYSLAILLKEAGLYSQSRIYGTDINSNIINDAKEGIYAAREFADYSKNYVESGGKTSLSDYYHVRYGSGIISEGIRKNVSFFRHNLASESVFIEAQLIMCSNVLIYFNEILQKKVFDLFYNSLHGSGYLVLGIKEKVPSSLLNTRFEKISPDLPVYRKISA